MNCTPDGIIEVCTTVESAAAPSTSEATAAASPTPKVTYENGLLAISAEDISLSDVLHEVSAKTGAAIEFPPGSASEPVFTNIGPGPVRDVLAALLNGTKFNYVMLGSENSSNTLEKIVLTQGDQSMEVAQSSPPDGAGQALLSVRSSRRAQAAAGSGQSEEDKQAQFMAEVESQKAANMQSFQQMMAAKGLVRTPDSATPAANSPAPNSPASDSPTPDSPTDSSNQ